MISSDDRSYRAAEQPVDLYVDLALGDIELGACREMSNIVGDHHRAYVLASLTGVFGGTRQTIEVATACRLEPIVACANADAMQV